MLADLEIRVILFFRFQTTFILLENGAVSQVTFSEQSDLFKVTIIRKIKPVFQLAKVSICLCA